MMTSEKPETFEEQYQAIRTGCGVVELVAWSSLAVTGADRQSFVNSFCTNDIKRLKPGESCETFFTNVKGKIVGHGIVSCRDDELAVVSVPGQSPALIAHLDRYVIREDVQLRDTSAERCYALTAGGGAASEALAAVAATRIPCALVGSEFECLVELSPPELGQFTGALRSRGAVQASLAFDAARIEAGVPLYVVDFDDRNLPQEVGRDKQAISFTKGCYLGQETVARIDALGHVNQRIVGVRWFGIDLPIVGTELFHGGVMVGGVTSTAFSPKLRAPLALAMVRREANAVGTRLESAAGTCEVIELPVID